METTRADTPPERLARYTRVTLTAAHWAVAREAVVAAALMAGPENAEDAKGLVSRLCQLLAAHPGWDHRHALELTVLVTEPAIATHLARLQAAGKSGKTRENHRADLRRIARGLAGTGQPARSSAGPVAVPAATGPLLTWLLTGQRPLVAVRAWEQHTGRRLTRNVLNPVVTALVTANAAQPSPGTLLALATVGTPASGEVSPSTWSRSVTEQLHPSTVPTSAGEVRPVSRAAVLQAARTALASQTAPTIAIAPDPDLLPAVVRDAIAAYRPDGWTEQGWAELGPLCHRLMVGFVPTSANSARSIGTVLAAFLAWAASRPGRPGQPTSLDAQELRTIGLADAYLDQLTAPDRSVATGAVRHRRARPRSGPGRPRPARRPCQRRHRPRAAGRHQRAAGHGPG